MKRRALETIGALAFGLSALALALHYGFGTPAESGDTAAAKPGPAPVSQNQGPPRIEVVFALDTTSSMSGLIDGAKRKIWGLANKLASGEPRPDIRIGLIGYRDVGDAYVTKKVAMTDDLDEIYGELMAFSAQGGGDGPEHVNQALSDALHGMQWSDEPNTLRLVFLVGDAPPHDEYDDGMTAVGLAEQAKQQGVIINTVRCGGDSATENVWRQVAAVAGGEYTSIEQDGGMVAVDTPYDQQLQELNRSLSDNVLGWGSAHDKTTNARKMKHRRAMSPAAAAEAASYAAKSGKMNSEDLLTALDKGKTLEELPEAELPYELQGKDAAAQRQIVESRRTERDQLNRQILEISKKRDAYLKDAERAAGADDAFDNKVMDNIAEQAAEIGVSY